MQNDFKNSGKSSFMVRTASGRDFPGIQLVETQCFSLPWPDGVLRNLIFGSSRYCYVAEKDGNIVGYVGFLQVLDEGHIFNVAVLPAHRRQGIGDLLVQKVIEHGINNLLNYLYLEVRESNSSAIALYEKHGFVSVGHRNNYYDKPIEDAVLMTRLLGKQAAY